jgi:hypothetical protein
MAFNGKITISELARLTNLSRPTLYKYVEEYENNDISNIPADILELFNYIYSTDVKDKSDIINYCIKKNKKSSESSVFDKIKMLYATDEQFKKKLILFVNEYCKNQK